MALLFADKYVPAILSRFGIIKKVNGNGYQGQIDELKHHAEVANNEMGEIKEGIASLNTKVDIIMRHNKL